MLGSSARADIAVGYFFIGGFNEVADDLGHLEKVRILVGRTDRQVLEEVAVSLQQHQALRARLAADALVQRGQRTRIAQETVDRIAEGVAGLPQKQSTETAVSKLRDMVASGKVEVRAYLQSALHAKAYLCWYGNHAEHGAAVVGSSNLTLAGFTGNTELNVRVTGDAEMVALREWFNTLWKDSENISNALVMELERSWALAKTPPYHVYLKALYELYYTDVGSGQLAIPAQDQLLANFQLDAVLRGLSMIESYGGCYIGDVVGLGKTFIGAELLRQLRVSYPNEGMPLILCPAGLKPMWQKFNERFGLGAEVVSHSVITAPAGAEFDEELGRYVDTAPQHTHGIDLVEKYPNRGPVLVDEAHNFRNVNRRSKGLANYLESGEHKVILLSATPQNLGPMDIYRQLRLFLHDTEHGLNIEPISLEAYFRNAQRWLVYRTEYENYEAELRSRRTSGARGESPSLPTEPDVPKAEIDQVLLPVFIRRRRKDIEDLYGDTARVGDKPVRFPEPDLDNVEYRLDKVYEKAGSLEDLEALLREHKGTRYRATDYIREDARGNPEYRNLFRARDRIARLMGVLLLKRLESSIEAFRSTLGSLINSNRNFREALESGIVPIGNTATRLLAGQSFDVDDLLEILRQEEHRRQQAGTQRGKLVHSTSDFDIDSWMRDLDVDHKVLKDIFERVKDIKPEDDDKLQELRNFLADPEVEAEKMLIFSEAETTVEYIYHNLNPDGQHAHIERLTGKTNHDAEKIVKRFSPKWNLGEHETLPGPEIQVLLATDVVSEGQNLQDCACVLNYDLHWNPVRLIQRFGRVDRIGTEHEKIKLHNMWPDIEVDAELNLTKRLGKRIQSFHDLIGLDSKLLSDTERLNASAMYRIYQEKKLPEVDDGLDEVSANQRAITLLQRIQDEDPDLWKTVTNLPDGIRSALRPQKMQAEASKENYAQNVLQIAGLQAPLMSPATPVTAPSPFDDPSQGETLVLLSAGGIKSCYAVNSDLQVRTISPAQFIAAAECKPETPAQPLPKDTNKRVMKAFDSFNTDFKQRLGKARRPRDTKARRYISRQLNAMSANAGDDKELQSRIEVLRQIFLGDVSPQVESALAEIRKLGLEGSVLLTRLEALRERYRLNPPDPTDQSQPVEPQVIRIVCSDGLV